MATWIKYIEPANGRGDPQFVYVSKETAIQCAREARTAVGKFTDTDQRLLEDFIVVNWATELDIEELP